MICTIIGAESKVSKVRGDVIIQFTILDDYEQKHYVSVSPKTMEYFDKANGIYWGDKEPVISNYIGMIISCKYELYRGDRYTTAFTDDFWRRVNES